MKRNSSLAIGLFILFSWQSIFGNQPLNEKINQNCKNLAITIEGDTFSFCDSSKLLIENGFSVNDYGKYRFLIKSYTNSTLLFVYANQRRWKFHSLLGIIVYSNRKDVVINNVYRVNSSLSIDNSNTLSFVEFFPKEDSLSLGYIYCDTIIRKNVDYDYYAKECWYEASTFTETVNAILFGQIGTDSVPTECEDCSMLQP